MERPMFDLERALAKWRKALQRNEALEDGDKEELESHLRDRIDSLIRTGMTDEAAFEEAVRRVGDPTGIGADYFKTRTRRRSGRPPWREGRWRSSLVANYLKIGLRKVRKQPLFSAINITGLAAGLACAAVIILYVTNELSYDSFHPDAGRIYRVCLHRKSAVGEFRAAKSPGPLAAHIRENYPAAEKAVRLVPPPENKDNVLVVNGEKRFFENRVWLADAEVFDVFRIPFVEGGPHGIFEKPNEVVITEGTARKYFGPESPLGKTLRIEIDYDTGRTELQDYTVMGVVRDAPANTHFTYDLLLSGLTLASNNPEIDTDWFHPPPKYTYVRLAGGVSAADFESQIQRNAKELTRILREQPNREGDFIEYFLQPVKDIHMKSRFMDEITPPGNRYYLIVYSLIAFLILLVGCMNFVNLSTALSSTRTKEVGLRKVVGAGRHQIVGQYLGESFLVTALAFVAALAVTHALLIPFNRLAGTDLGLGGLLRPAVFLSILGLLFLVAFGSGFYPALVLMSAKPLAVLHGKSTPSSRGALLQKFLVIAQFSISVFLIISTLTVFKQLSYMRGRALGFDLEQKIALRVRSNLGHLRKDFEAIKLAFLRDPAVTGATVSSSIPGDVDASGYYLTTQPENFRGAARLKVITVDDDFLSEYGIRVVAGRPFRKDDEGADRRGAFLVNRTGARELGFATAEEALGKGFQAHYHRLTKQIVGVTEDFHYRGMKDLVDPIILDLEESLYDTITLSVRPGGVSQALGFIRGVWDEHFPGVPFEYSFVDENFGRVYFYEKQMGRLLAIITAIGVGIACLGLFGLAFFVARQREKEIGIRKVLGATPADIVSLLSRKYVPLILVSAAVACPAAWYSMARWLQGFAYRIDMGALVFVSAVVAAFLVAMGTVAVQGLRAAVANPVDSLRNE
jgi:putative ABC transport system permease protein